MSRAVVASLVTVMLATFTVVGLALAETIPHDAYRYRSEVVRNARLIWGLNAPTATFAGQIHQESRWNANAQSKFATGLAQFTPATVDWIGDAFPQSLGDKAPKNPAWAIRALATYDKYLWDKIKDTLDDCQHMAMALSAYNGGLGWLIKDRHLTSAKGADASIWFGQISEVNAGRAPNFFAENRGYPAKILIVWEPLYTAANFGPGSCP